MTVFSRIDPMPKLARGALRGVCRIVSRRLPMGLCVLRLYRALDQAATPVSSHSSGARLYGLYHRTRLHHALHDGADPRRRPCALLDAISCALLGHCARVWPRCDVLVSPGARFGSL